jgi:fluoride exporter
LIGVAWSAPWLGFWGSDPELLRGLLMFGFFGGYTTVSSFSWNTLSLLHEGQWLQGILNMFGSLLLCLAAVFAGAAIGQIGG